MLDLYGHAAIACGDTVVIHGGNSITNDELNDRIFYYNVETNVWSVPSTDTEINRLLNPMESNPDELDFEPLSDALEHSPQDDTTKPLPVQRHALCLSEDEKSMYLSGGHGDDSISSQLYCYNFETEKWTKMRNFVDRYDHKIIAYNRKIWAFGGLTSDMVKSSDVFWYDLDSEAVGYITISDDPMALSYPTPTAATHYYTAGYPGTILDVSLPGVATEEHPLSVTAIDLVTLKRRNIIRPSNIFSEYTWLQIFSSGPNFVVLGNLGNREETNLEFTHMFYWDLREFGFLDPHAQSEPDEHEGTLNYDMLKMFRNGLLTDFEITCVQGDQRPPLLHKVVNNTIPTPLNASTPSENVTNGYNPYESVNGNTVLDRGSPAPSLRASEGLLNETDSVLDLATIPIQASKSTAQSDLSLSFARNPTISTQPVSSTDAAASSSGSPSPTTDSLTFQPSKRFKRQLTPNSYSSSRLTAIKASRDDRPVFKLSAPIRTHSLILYARWPHFRRIMQSGMSEAHSRRIYIPEPVSWVKKLVEYMYSDSVSTYTVDDVSGLLILANLYELPRLRRLCLEHISRSAVTHENAVTVYWRAYLATETDLQKTAAAYCLQHWSQIVRTEKFETLPKDIMVMLCQEASSPSIPIPQVSASVGLSRQPSTTFPVFGNRPREGTIVRQNQQDQEEDDNSFTPTADPSSMNQVSQSVSGTPIRPNSQPYLFTQGRQEPPQNIFASSPNNSQNTQDQEIQEVGLEENPPNLPLSSPISSRVSTATSNTNTSSASAKDTHKLSNTPFFSNSANLHSGTLLRQNNAFAESSGASVGTNSVVITPKIDVLQNRNLSHLQFNNSPNASSSSSFSNTSNNNSTAPTGLRRSNKRSGSFENIGENSQDTNMND